MKYGSNLVTAQGKPEAGGYHQQPPQQYPSQPGYPPTSGQSRYPGPPTPQHGQYNPAMPPPSSGTSQPSFGNPSRQPGYQGYSAYNMQPSSYYGQRPPHSYPPTPFGLAQGNPTTVEDPKSYGSQDQAPNNGSIPAVSDQHGVERHIMSPNRRTPQPLSQPHPGSVQSPMAAAQSPHVHHAHPAVAQLRGPSPAPGSPSSAGQPRVNPLSPPSVRPSTPLQQGPVPRGPPEHNDPSYVPYRPYPPQQQSGYPQHTSQAPAGYPQHMMSSHPQSQQPLYPGNQSFASTPQHHPNMPGRPPAPPIGGKPAHSMAMPTPNYPQNQPAAAYPQPSNCAPYYDSMGPQPHHLMQEGYSTASPAPTERRPSLQGSHPSAGPAADLQTRPGAAAAAAAAMAAAAHTAQPGISAAPKGPATSYYNQQPHVRPNHPNYHAVQQQSQNDGYYSMGYQRMPHPGALPNNRMMAPPMGSPTGQRLPPPSSYASGYPQPGPPQQGPYPGHYSHISGDPNHPHALPQGYPAPSSSGYDTSAAHPPHEETPKVKTSARSASQKLQALYEPADEPGRREFIDSVLKYWENKEIPLKNAPLMGRKTLDLFRLYRMVKERGFWQEVTDNKLWPEISNLMGLGSTSTSGFTLKKQYCKYLYGYECKMERGEAEPQEALARVIEANRKKKLQAEQQASKDEASKSQPGTPVASGNSAPPTPQSMTPQPAQAPVPQAQPNYSSQPYAPQSEYPQQQMRPPYEYGHLAPPPGYVPQHQPPVQEPRQAGSYPPHMTQGNPPAPAYPGQYPHHGTPHGVPPPRGPLAVDKNFTRSGSRTPGSGTPAPQPESDIKKESAAPHQPPYNPSTPTPVKPPVPTDTSLAVSNPFNEPSKPAASPAPLPPTVSQNHPPPTGPPHPQYHQRPAMAPHDPYRAAYPPRPGMPPVQQPPFSNSSTPPARAPHPNQPSHMGAVASSHQTASPRNSAVYPPTLPGHPLPTRSSFQGQIPHSMYGGPTGSHPYPGMKRTSSDTYGPPNKFPRPEHHFASRYPQGQTTPFRPEHEATLRQRFPSSVSVPPTNVTYSSVGSNQGPHITAPYARYHRSTAGPVTFSKSESLRQVGGWMPHQPTQRVASPVPYSSQLTKMMADGRVPKRQAHPLRSSHPMIKRNIPHFPPDSVEATQPKYVKFQRKTCKDVEAVEAWRVIMALKSGLLGESTWAFNILTFFLYDQNTVVQFKLSQLPGLLDALVEHYRRCLSELFSLPGEADLLGLPRRSVDCVEKVESGEPCDASSEYTFVARPKQRGRKKKNCALISKYGSKFTKLPVKVEPRNDPFVVDRTDQWDSSHLVNLADDLAHIVVTFSQDSCATKSKEIAPQQEKEHEAKKLAPDESVVVVEATLEDVLSIPCSVLFPDEYDIHGASAKDLVVKKNHGSADHVEQTNRSGSVDDGPETSSDSRDAKSKTDDCLSAESSEHAGATSVQTGDKVETVPSCLPVSADSEAEAKSVEEPMDAEIASNGVDVTDKLNDVTNTSDDVVAKSSDALKQPNGPRDAQVKKEVVEIPESKCGETSVEKSENPPALCNGTQSDDGSVSEKSVTDAVNVKHTEIKTEADAAAPGDVKAEKPHSGLSAVDCTNSDEVKNKKQPTPSRVTCRVDEVLEERNVVLLEDEALASDGSMSHMLSGSVLSRTRSKCEELASRLQCISNILRGLSFIPANAKELCQHRNLMRAASGSLLLRHKHRTRPRPVPAHDVSDTEVDQDDAAEGVPESSTTDNVEASSLLSAKKRRTADLFAPAAVASRRDREICTEHGPRPPLSSTVFQDNDPTMNKAYSEPWWWDCVNRLREDSLVILCNVATSLDLSKLPDDNTALAVLEACLHWTGCPSSDASDPLTPNLRYQISPQRLSLEILTKLTLCDHNIDLILATRPFSRIEKLFSVLVTFLCDRKDQTLREFAVVLLSNLSSGDVTAARAIALQKGSLCGLLSFLEECEETGMNHKRMFAASHQPINCGTTEYMMQKCARTILSLAQVQENKPCFVKHQLRLLSLSMSQLLSAHVTSIIASVLFELSHENT